MKKEHFFAIAAPNIQTENKKEKEKKYLRKNNYRK
jgi:hypothetical protein